MSLFGGSLPGMNIMRGYGQGGASKDMYYSGFGGINTSDQEQEGKGSTTMLGVHGQRRDTGDEWYVEVKAPSAKGDRTSVPYQRVLPKYKDAAEKAISHDQIPKEQEKRVKQYFESLNGGKK